MSKLKQVGVGLGVALVVAGVAGGTLWYQTSRDFHHSTTAAAFTDSEVLLVRPVHLPFLSDRTIDLWWVSLATGKVTSHAREQASFDRDLDFAGFADGRAWFFAPNAHLVEWTIARTGNDRFDLSPQLAAHPTLAPRMKPVATDDAGLLVEDQRAETFRVDRSGRITQLDRLTAMTLSLERRVDVVRGDYDQRLHVAYSIMGKPTPDLSRLPLVRAGFPLETQTFQPVLPREGGGYLVIGESLQSGANDSVKHVIMRVDPNGTVRWQQKLIDTLGDTALDDFTMGDPWISVLVRAVHTTPQRVWVAYEASETSTDSKGRSTTNRETRLVQLDAATGNVLSSVQPHL